MRLILFLVLCSCNHPTTGEIVDAEIQQEVSCLAHSAITDTKALVAATVICSPKETFHAEISIFDKDGFACGNTRDNVSCGESVIYECSSPGLEVVSVRYRVEGSLVLIDCPIAKR